MTDLSVNNLVKSFEIGRNVLDGLSFTVTAGERVGILGHNGCGKTTLFRILTGELRADEGEIAIAPNKRMGLISQIPVYPEGFTTEMVLKDAHRRLYAISERMEELTVQMESDQSPALLREYDRLQEDFRRLGGYEMDVDRARVANGLDISPAMLEQEFASLSGGEKTRVNLARLILENTDILLLDEPTNHLDLRATEWLEDYLLHFKGTVLAISHDRYFLDKVVQRCIEISDGKAEFYSGNYSFYVEERQRRFEEKLKKYEKDQAKIEQLTRAAEQMHLWAFMGNDKLHKRAFSMEKRIEKLSRSEKPTEQRKLSVKFKEREFVGDEVLVMDGIEKGYGERVLFSGLDALVTGGERIALIGDNGTGKSTLVKLIMNVEKPDKGWLYLGPTVRTAYLPQLVGFSNEERSALDTMLWDCRCQPQEARDRLAAFGFRGEDVMTPVGAACSWAGTSIFSSSTSRPTISTSRAVSGWRTRFRTTSRRCCSCPTTAILSTSLPRASGSSATGTSPIFAAGIRSFPPGGSGRRLSRRSKSRRSASSPRRKSRSPSARKTTTRPSPASNARSSARRKRSRSWISSPRKTAAIIRSSWRSRRRRTSWTRL